MASISKDFIYICLNNWLHMNDEPLKWLVDLLRTNDRTINNLCVCLVMIILMFGEC